MNAPVRYAAAMAKDMTRLLKRSIGHKPKKPRVPAKATTMALPLPAETVAALDAWRAPRHLTRAEALAELVTQGLRLHELMGRMKR